MRAKDATAEDIRELKARLGRKQTDRLCEMQMDEVVRMVGKKRPTAGRETARAEGAIVATGMAAIAGAAALLGSTGAIPMGYAAAMAGVALAGTAGEIARWA